MKKYGDFVVAIADTESQMRHLSYVVKPSRWQSTDVSGKPEAEMREILNVSFQVPLMSENLDFYRNTIRPNLPWADDHFEERVSGIPWNPGDQWKNWPWSLSADNHRTAGSGRFSHTYMERYWPKLAGHMLTDENFKRHGIEALQRQSTLDAMSGIRYDYGDLRDVVNHLANDPTTRQAYLPVWFPEDTGVVHGERVPCTLGYHFILRNGFFHHTYYIRSCDFYRHFRDDLYLSVRLHLWVLGQLRQHPAGRDYEVPNYWNSVKPGFFTFHCVSMHMFINDWHQLFGKKG